MIFFVLMVSPSSLLAISFSLSDQDKAIWNFFAAQLCDYEGDFKQAVIYYQRAIQHDPNSPTLRRYLVDDLIRLKKFNEASLEYRKLKEQKAGDYKIDYILGQVHEAQGKPGVAEKFYREALISKPEDSELLTKLAIVLLEQKKIEEALEYIKKALEINQHNRLARRLLVKYFLWQSKWEQAEALLEQALEIFPEDEEWLDALANILAKKNQDSAAADIYKSIQKKNPNNISSYKFLAKYYLRQREWSFAIEQLSEILKKDTKDLLARRNIGLAYYETGNLTAAKQQLKLIPAAGVADALTHYLLGMVYYKENLKYLAAKELSIAIKLDSQLLEAYIKLAYVLLEIKEVDQAAAVLKQAAQNFPQSPLVIASYGWVLFKLDQLEPALANFKQVLQWTPKNAQIYFDIGRVYFELQKNDLAIAAWKKAIELNPDFAEAYNHLGYTYAERAWELEQAVKWCQRACELSPKNGYYWDSLGWAYYQQQEYSLALKALEKAVVLLKKYEKEVELLVYEHLADAYFKLSQYKAALNIWENILLKENKYKPEEIKTRIEETRKLMQDK